MTTFDVIVKQNHELVLLDVNNGGNYGIHQPSQLLFDVQRHLITNPTDLDTYKDYQLGVLDTPTEMRMCGMSDLYVMKITR